ncbi:hypothetical protein Z949_3771 [Sulfitobacter guttiformis KCTC 32187]|nr:hypothetical protein Z949_3771 [Sulfitobacter guttiformis KCTC 32187]
MQKPFGDTRMAYQSLGEKLSLNFGLIWPERWLATNLTI